MDAESERKARLKSLQDALRDSGSEINIDALLVSEASEQTPKQIVNNDNIFSRFIFGSEKKIKPKRESKKK